MPTGHRAIPVPPRTLPQTPTLGVTHRETGVRSLGNPPEATRWDTPEPGHQVCPETPAAAWGTRQTPACGPDGAPALGVGPQRGAAPVGCGRRALSSPPGATGAVRAGDPPVEAAPPGSILRGARVGDARLSSGDARARPSGHPRLPLRGTPGPGRQGHASFPLTVPAPGLELTRKVRSNQLAAEHTQRPTGWLAERKRSSGLRTWRSLSGDPDAPRLPRGG